MKEGDVLVTHCVCSHGQWRLTSLYTVRVLSRPAYGWTNGNEQSHNGT